MNFSLADVCLVAIALGVWVAVLFGLNVAG